MSLYLPDANVLIYAFCEGAPHHKHARKWLEQVAQNKESICLCEIVEGALLRIPTLPSVKMAPVHEVLSFWREDLLGYPYLRRISAGVKHAEILSQLIKEQKLFGNDLNDAWLSALAIEQGATLVSIDQGFRRFSKLKWLNLLKG